MKDRLARLRNDGEIRRFGMFLAVGLVNTLVGYALFAGFIRLGLDYAAALALATMGGVAFNFQSIGRIVFANRDNRRIVRFVLVYAAQFVLNLAGLRVLHAAGLSPLLGQALLTPVMAVLSFLAMRRFVYGTGGSGSPAADGRSRAI